MKLLMSFAIYIIIKLVEFLLPLFLIGFAKIILINDKNRWYGIQKTPFFCQEEK